MNVLTRASDCINCPICHAKPIQMNDLTNFGSKVFEQVEFFRIRGISPLPMCGSAFRSPARMTKKIGKTLIGKIINGTRWILRKHIDIDVIVKKN